MFGLNFMELLVIALVVLVLFGNRLPQVLGDLGKGVKAFKEGMDGTDETVMRSVSPSSRSSARTSKAAPQKTVARTVRKKTALAKKTRKA